MGGELADTAGSRSLLHRAARPLLLSTRIQSGLEEPAVSLSRPLAGKRLRRIVGWGEWPSHIQRIEYRLLRPFAL
jgi:hypothetical protein